MHRLPSSVWKDGHDNDKPYRTIKTLVHKFCKGLELKVSQMNDQNQLNLYFGFRKPVFCFIFKIYLYPGFNLMFLLPHVWSKSSCSSCCALKNAVKNVVFHAVNNTVNYPKVLEDLECLSIEDVNILRPLVDSFLTALGYDLTNLITAGKCFLIIYLLNKLWYH